MLTGLRRLSSWRSSRLWGGSELTRLKRLGQLRRHRATHHVRTKFTTESLLHEPHDFFEPLVDVPVRIRLVGRRWRSVHGRSGVDSFGPVSHVQIESCSGVVPDLSARLVTFELFVGLSRTQGHFSLMENFVVGPERQSDAQTLVY